MIEIECKRCLLRDMPESDYYQSVLTYRVGLPEKEKVSDTQYERRLEACSGCEHLSNGVCGQCGCYVEMRASARSMHCPPPLERW